MDTTVEKVIQEFEKRSKREWEELDRLDPKDFQSQMDRFLLAVGPATGQMMNLLIREAKAKTILEVGSSYGYSTVWLAEAARETGGKVISLEIHPEKQKHARESIQKAGLDRVVDFRLGDARESLGKLTENVDFVLLDLWKDLYIPCFDLFYPRLNRGALILADNMLFPENSREDAAAYRKHIRAKSGIQSVLLNVGFGIELSRYQD
jgi:predicted O-methyltransferase YrrM